MLYQLNTVMRLFGFLSRGIVFLAVGFVLGILYNEGKVHFPSLSFVPIAHAATVDPYLRSPSGSPINEGIIHFDYSATDFAEGTAYYKFKVSTDHYPYEYSSACTSIDPGIITASTEITGTPGDYSAVSIDEYSDSSCSSLVMSNAIDDPFTVVSLHPTATTTATTTEALTAKDDLFLYGVIIFLLCIPVWGRIFKL